MERKRWLAGQTVRSENPIQEVLRMPYLLLPFRVLIRWIRSLVRLIGKAPDYVTFTLEGPYPEMVPPRPPFPKRLLSSKKPSLLDLRKQMRQVARDRRVKGVLVRIYSVGSATAALQSLRNLILELREAGKRVVVWSHHYDMATYYVASAADEVLLQHAGQVTAVGMGRGYLFLADALRRVGLEANIVQISPYKTAGDTLTRTEFSEEAREMANWLADDVYEQYVDGIATGRGITAEEARALIDGGPYSGTAALEAGAVDALLGEEELPKHLGSNKPARLVDYGSAKKRLLLPPLKMPGKYVAVLRIAGDIIDGRSAQPPVKPPFRLPLLFSERAGDLTVVQQARALAKNKRAGAVVVFVDSGGGSATSSEAMAAALQEVAKKKPVIVSMGDVAASGGYFVATPGQKILAQPGTITGSIGVLAGKLVNAGLYEKLLWHREVVSRGEHAELFASSRPFTEQERRGLFEQISRTYDVFLDRVMTSRGMTREAVDAVGSGRVWTGRQAKEHGLVDELGGLDLAIQRAREKAGLGRRSRVVEVKAGRKLLAPAAAGASTWLRYAAEGLRMLRAGNVLAVCPVIVVEEEL